MHSIRLCCTFEIMLKHNIVYNINYFCIIVHTLFCKSEDSLFIHPLTPCPLLDLSTILLTPQGCSQVEVEGLAYGIRIPQQTMTKHSLASYREAAASWGIEQSLEGIFNENTLDNKAIWLWSSGIAAGKEHTKLRLQQHTVAHLFSNLAT